MRSRPRIQRESYMGTIALKLIGLRCFPDDNRLKNNQKRTFLAFNIWKNLTKRKNTDELTIPKFWPLIVHQTGPNESFCYCFAQKVNEEGLEAKTKQHLIYCTESSMKEFHKHFVESLLEGVKAKFKWIGCLFFI